VGNRDRDESVSVCVRVCGVEVNGRKDKTFCFAADDYADAVWPTQRGNEELL
jgi:hypothetical protein